MSTDAKPTDRRDFLLKLGTGAGVAAITAQAAASLRSLVRPGAWASTSRPRRTGSTSTRSSRPPARARKPRRTTRSRCSTATTSTRACWAVPLKEKACERGVVHQQALVERIEQAENGDIRALKARDGQLIDIFTVGTTEKSNKAPEPTPGAVTPRATEDTSK